MYTYPIHYKTPQIVISHSYGHTKELESDESYFSNTIPYSVVVLQNSLYETAFVKQFWEESNLLNDPWLLVFMIAFNGLITFYGCCRLSNKANEIVKPLDQLISNLEK